MRDTAVTVLAVFGAWCLLAFAFVLVWSVACRWLMRPTPIRPRPAVTKEQVNEQLAFDPFYGSPTHTETIPYVVTIDRNSK